MNLHDKYIEIFDFSKYNDILISPSILCEYYICFKHIYTRILD